MISPEAIARAYVACIEISERAPTQAPELAEELQELRSELHALMMQVFLESGIPFADRADATRVAFNIVQSAAVDA